MSVRRWKECPCGVGFYGSSDLCASCQASGSPELTITRRRTRQRFGRIHGYQLAKLVRLVPSLVKGEECS